MHKFRTQILILIAAFLYGQNLIQFLSLTLETFMGTLTLEKN
jgi:hypothetical protein